jgi:general secretion pathway protein D
MMFRPWFKIESICLLDGSLLPVGVDISRVVLRSALMALGLLTLTGCSPGSLEQRDDQSQNAADVVRSADLQPRYPQPVRGNDNAGPAPKAFSFFGTATPEVSKETTQSIDPAAEAKDGYTLNFENAPVASVAKSILGDILGVGYVIDPRAQGSISLSSGRPIAKKDILFVLENALRANNLIMVRDNTGYRITPANDGSVGAIDQADGVGVSEPGYGMTVIPLKYVSGITLSRLLEGFAARPGAIRTDPSGTILMVIGNGSERQSALDTVRSFDVDWMRGQSVGIYPVSNSAPEPLVAELEKIMDSGESGLSHNLVKFQVVTRQNAIMVVAAKPDLLRTAATWISRLDSPNSAASGVKVYKVRYGEAKQIAQLLNEIFVGGSSGSSLDSASNEVSPSSGAAPLTPAERLTGGRPPPSINNAATGANNGAQPLAAGNATSGIPAAANTGAATSTAGAAATGGGILPGVRITADVVNNSVLIYANQENYRIIERTLNQLDRPKLQVAIDVTIAEVTLNDSLSYGVQFYLNNQYGAIINSATGQPTAATSAPPGFNILVGNNATPHAIINALHGLTDVKILSNPSLVVVDNQPATLEVGDQVPISTGSATVLSTSNTVVNTVDYKNTGIILHVQPRVNSNGNVLLDIEQEISAVPQTESASLTPTISQRKVKSSISVASGQMVLLAGLVSETQAASRSGVPVLDQLPLIGGAFGTTGKSTVRTELIIFIRPQIIRDGADASMVAEELRSKMRGGKIGALSLPAALQVGARPLQ